MKTQAICIGHSGPTRAAIVEATSLKGERVNVIQ